VPGAGGFDPPIESVPLGVQLVWPLPVFRYADVEFDPAGAQLWVRLPDRLGDVLLTVKKRSLAGGLLVGDTVTVGLSVWVRLLTFVGSSDAFQAVREFGGPNP
jgi:hypothetical protein